MLQRNSQAHNGQPHIQVKNKDWFRLIDNIFIVFIQQDWESARLHNGFSSFETSQVPIIYKNRIVHCRMYKYIEIYLKLYKSAGGFLNVKICKNIKYLQNYFRFWSARRRLVCLERFSIECVSCRRHQVKLFIY